MSTPQLTVEQLVEYLTGRQDSGEGGLASLKMKSDELITKFKVRNEVRRWIDLVDLSYHTYHSSDYVLDTGGAGANWSVNTNRG